MGERIAVIGAGYVGLVSGTCFAEVGHHVICVDKDSSKIESLARAEVPFYEPGLQEKVAIQIQQGRLSFTSYVADAVAASDIVFIAVGTPSLPNGEADVSQVKDAVVQVAQAADKDLIIVLKSTVPVGTARMAMTWAAEWSRGHRLDIVSNPEFLREGSAIHDTFHADRIVIGSFRKVAGERIACLQAPFAAPVLYTDPESAELIKYASNAFLAAKISFINEVANLCDKVGANVELVARGMGMDKRIGPHFLQAGIGYGGSCFPKDTRAQLRIAEDVDYDFKILRAVIEVNHLQRERFVDRIEQVLGGEVSGKKLAVMGLTFKPNTDDLRDAPSMEVIRLLLDKGAEVSAYDPVAAAKAAVHIPKAVCHADPYNAIAGADAMVIVTEWDAIKQLDYNCVKSALRLPIIIDGRNCLVPERMSNLGFHYVSIGRP